MSRSSDQELSPAAAHRILRSIAYWDWTRLDQAMVGFANRLPVIADVPALEEVFDHIEDDVDYIEGDVEEGPSPAFRLCKRPGGWYLNEVPQELLDECEKELGTAPLIDLRQVLGVGYDEGAEETAAGPARFHQTEGQTA
jgi:hypothetical protein